MAPEQEINTESTILKASKEIFIKKGFDGTTMKDIAEEAGINKSLLHYYFRSKENLFRKVLGEALKQFIPVVNKMMMTDISLFEKIEFFVETYIDMITENPYIPGFVLQELNRKPKSITDLIENFSGYIKNNALVLINKQIEKEIKAGIIIPVKPQHLITNLIALSIFPFVARPILQTIIFNNDMELYNVFLQERKREVVKFIINSIKKK